MKADKKCWVMLPHDPLLEEAPLHRYFFLLVFAFLVEKQKKEAAGFCPCVFLL